MINGRYSKNKNFTTFTAVVPADKPKYVFLTIMDEPQAVPKAPTASRPQAGMPGP